MLLIGEMALLFHAKYFLRGDISGYQIEKILAHKPTKILAEILLERVVNDRNLQENIGSILRYIQAL